MGWGQEAGYQVTGAGLGGTLSAALQNRREGIVGDKLRAASFRSGGVGARPALDVQNPDWLPVAWVVANDL